MSHAHELTAEAFDEEVLNCTGLVLVEFWSRTCPPCLQLNPEYEKAALEHADAVKFTKVASQDTIGLFRQFHISATPTLVLFRDGKELGREVGFHTCPEIAAWISDTI